MPQGLAVGYNNLWVDGGAHVLVKYTKGVPFLFKYKKEKKLIIGMSKDMGTYQTPLGL